MKKKFLVTDDHPMVRAGIISLVRVFYPESDFYEAETVAEAKTQLEKYQIDCALLDYKIGAEHAISLIPHIQHYFPEVKMLVISMMDSRELGAACIKAGAHGFLNKAAHPDEVKTAIETVLSGRVYASIEISRKLFCTESCKDDLGGLTKREMEVFSLLGQGTKVSAIATQLGISVKTVEAHRDHIKNKLSIDTAAQLMIRASRWLDDQSAL
jgi:DNA-binding NarL/FixJ family response regulator